MKKLCYILIFFLPAIVVAQQNLKTSSPLDFMWMNVGNAGFSANYAYLTRLAFSQSGQPYVAYDYAGNSGKVTVMKFDGTNWLNVGNPGFSAGEVYFTNLAFSPSGEPMLHLVTT